MEEIIRVKDQYYILATSSLAESRTLVIKHNDAFAIFDRYGDIQPIGAGQMGLFFEGTRYLCRLTLNLDGQGLLLLSSTTKEDNSMVAVDLTNPDISQQEGKILIPRGTLHLFRSKLIWQQACYERLRFSNFSLQPVKISLFLNFDADFSDIFEVRGLQRKERGQRLDSIIEPSRITLAYRGLDDVVRRTIFDFAPNPASLQDNQARFDLEVEPRKQETICLTISCQRGESQPAQRTYTQAYVLVGDALKAARTKACEIYTSNDQFNRWLNRSQSDLNMMLSDTPDGIYPYAGVPWFNCPFGRDGIITALQVLWMNPGIARGVLAFLAATQAATLDSRADAEPGKIVHEMRQSEMTILNEVPFGQYYGSVDSTPLFIILAGAYYERTGDLAFIQQIWPNVEAALEWIEKYGDGDGDGFVEYARHSPKGLVHQGWKDSLDAVWHRDGTLARAPIALCEVQGYVYAAKIRAAELARILGDLDRANQLRNQAQELKEKFQRAFWNEELGVYAIALDGDKRQCEIRTSNAGQCMFTQIAHPDHAQVMAQNLMMEDFFSDWGVRTVASSEARYNPMSYHNGSVWPHDNSLIAWGLSLFEFKESVLKIMSGLFSASQFLDLHRMPELFCGFVRRPGEGPILYPVACAPQAWAAGTVFLLLQSCLGMAIDISRKEIAFYHPTLPDYLQEVHILNLRIGDGSVDLALRRYPQNVGIQVMRRDGNIRLVAVK